MNFKLEYIITREEEIEKRRLYRNIKKRGKCLVCEHSFDLTFHHVNKSLKSFDIAKASYDRKISLNSFSKELKKCVLLCRCCHNLVEKGILSLEETK
jgi:hypothetical protein